MYIWWSTRTICHKDFRSFTYFIPIAWWMSFWSVCNMYMELSEFFFEKQLSEKLVLMELWNCSCVCKSACGYYFFTFISWFPDGYTIRNPFTFLDMACRQELPSGKHSCRPTIRRNGPFLTLGSCRRVPDGEPSGIELLTVFHRFLTVFGRQ